MSDWASPILFITKKEEWIENPSNQNTATCTKRTNLTLGYVLITEKPNCIDYRKPNSHIVTARQIKTGDSLGKVISNYPLPTIDNLLAWFNRCKSFSSMDLRSGYYHIWLTKESAEKTAFMTDKGKWIFHSLPFGINIGPSAFTYVLGQGLAPCTKFALNYLDDIMTFSRTWEEHLEHLEDVFKWLEAADLKIESSKCEFFKTKVH